MITIDSLKQFGANVDEGLKRCMNNEEFYLKLVTKAAEDASYDKLKDAVEAGDLDAAFEAAHALKGVSANLALTPIYEPIFEITELLRARTETDYSGYLKKIMDKKDELKSLLG